MDGTAPAPAEAGEEDVATATYTAAPPAVASDAPPEVIHRSLVNSIKDSVAWAVMVGAGERYIIPFIVLDLVQGRSGLLRLALISSLPNLVGSLVQCFAADAVDRAGRRRPFCVGAAMGQALAWLPFCLGIFLPREHGFWLMLVSYALYIGFANFGGPAWSSLMGDLVPPDRRGRYFGLRTTLPGTSQIMATLIAGKWLTYAKETAGLSWGGLSSQNFGFVVLFLIACVARMISARYLYLMYEPPYVRTPSDHFTLLDFLRRAPRAHFGRFVFYGMLMNVGVWFLTPYLSWYVLDELHFTPLQFAYMTAANWIALYSMTTLWGRLMDRVGSKRVLAIGGIGLVATPILLLFSNSFGWIMAVQVYDGVMTAAYTIGTLNYLFDVVTSPKRARCAAYNTLFTTVGLAVGVLGGGLIAQCAPMPTVVLGVHVGHPFTLVLIGSAILRLLPSLFLLRSFEEFRLRRPAFVSVPPAAGSPG